MINKDRNFFQYNSGDLVYIIYMLINQLQTSPREIAIKYIGPLVVYKITDPHNYLLMTLDGKTLWGFERERLQPAIIRTSQGNVCNLPQLRQVVNISMMVELLVAYKARYIYLWKKLVLKFFIQFLRRISFMLKCTCIYYFHQLY